MPKILYVLKEPYPWDIRADKICNSLAGAGFEVFLLSLWKKGLPQREKIGKLNIIRACFNKQGLAALPVSHNPNWANEIRDTAEKIKPDMIMPREIMLAEICGKIGKKRHIPVIMDMAENYPAAMKLWKKYNKNFVTRALVHNFKLPERFESKSVRLMDGIITVCDEQNERLNSQYNYPLKKMAVVHNTPKLKWFENCESDFTKKNIVFGHHGHMTAEKRLDIFLKGFLLAAKKHENIELILAGRRECFDELKQIAGNSEFSKRISFTGKYEFSELPKLLKIFDVGVLPYLANDFNNFTIHNKLFDFFAAGKPALVSDANPAARVVKQTKTGISGDCSTPEKCAALIEQILKEDLQKFSENGKKAFREKYNWENDAEILINFIKKKLSSNRRGSR